MTDKSNDKLVRTEDGDKYEDSTVFAPTVLADGRSAEITTKNQVVRNVNKYFK